MNPATIHSFPDLETCSRACAEEILAICRRENARKGFSTLVLAGGSTPRRLYELLATPPLEDLMPWEGLHLFWGDERVVAPEHEWSNFRMAGVTLLAKNPLPAPHLHPIRGFGQTPDQAAESYEKELRDFFHRHPVSGEGDGFSPHFPLFDCILLGMGEDGHTASLFPGKAALEEKKRWVVAELVPGQPPFVPRLSLSLPVLNNGRNVLFLAAGAKKKRLLQQFHATRPLVLPYPAARVRPTSGLLQWFVAG